MTQLNVKLGADRLAALRKYAARRRTPISWLIKEYIDYLLAGGRPVAAPVDSDLSLDELAELAQKGGSFDWLYDEPDIYSMEDGDPVEW